MYVFPNYEDIKLVNLTVHSCNDYNCTCVISVPGKLKEFIEDLHSGKLHKDFHNSPEV